MRILHLTTHLNTGGITIYILRLLKSFVARGAENFVISSGGDYEEAFKARGAKVINLPIKTKSELSPKLYFHLPKLIRFIRDNQIDIIHAHTRIAMVMAFWAQVFTHVPVVTTSHGFYARRLGRRINPAWGDRVIAISPAVGEHLIKDHRVPLAKVRVINNGIDLEEIDEAYRRHDPATAKIHFGFLPTDLVVGNVARMVPDKGQEFLIRSLPYVKEKFPNIRLLVVGDGPYRGELEKLADSLGLKAHVFFTGTLRDVTYGLAAMDVFAFPATWREGFGLSIVEAMACRKPVIVTNVWALNDLVAHQENGLLIDAKNEKALSDAIITLFKDAPLREKIQSNARKMTEDHFSLTRMAGELFQTYEDLLEKT